VIIEASAPTRVDLEGGTIDIWPLYLFHPGATTVNFAISPRTFCRIETRADNCIILESTDRGERVETTLTEIDELAQDTKLELLSKLVHFFRPTVGFTLTAESHAPAGAGLAGSSSLFITAIGALNKFCGDRYPESAFIDIAANIETTVIRVPAGFQDYYPAQYGGLSSISFGIEGRKREAIPVDSALLESRFELLYTGEPRNSGTNNWDIFKRHIDELKTDTQPLTKLFDGIRDSAARAREALLANDWDSLSATMKAAFPQRKQLAPTITTPHMDKLIETALANGAEAAKVCGAGGGGCIAFLCAEGRRADVENALNAAFTDQDRADGAKVLEWNFAAKGLTVNVV
jgi:D-glycero-alpha-D-manno-heptose-7-phosphate kinase